LSVFGDPLTANGVFGEKIGISPDVQSKTTKEHLLNGKDITLEKSLEMPGK